MSDELIAVEGYNAVLQHFGGWPSFHDAEVTRLLLDREGLSILGVHAFRMTSDVTESGHYRTIKHAIVHFRMGEISNMELYGFNGQNVLSGLTITVKDAEFHIELHPCYGLHGSLLCKRLSLIVESGIPAGSIYEETK